MAKYIIELNDEANKDLIEDAYYSCKQIPWWGVSKEIVKRLTPYTEPNRKAIEDEVWEFARHLINMSPSVTEDIYRSMNGGKGIGVAVEMTYQEAKAEYDAWRKEKEEIHVGDEVEAESGNKACVLYENPDGTQMFVFQADGIAAWWSKCAIHKTGKNHPEVAELLKKMREEK